MRQIRCSFVAFVPATALAILASLYVELFKSYVGGTFRLWEEEASHYVPDER